MAGSDLNACNVSRIFGEIQPYESDGGWCSESSLHRPPVSDQPTARVLDLYRGFLACVPGHWLNRKYFVSNTVHRFLVLR